MQGKYATSSLVAKVNRHWETLTLNSLIDLVEALVLSCPIDGCVCCMGH